MGLGYAYKKRKSRSCYRNIMLFIPPGNNIFFILISFSPLLGFKIIKFSHKKLESINITMKKTKLWKLRVWEPEASSSGQAGN